jgi:hypothetical protein
MTRDAQTDTCHGACTDGCAVCGGIFEVNFAPRDIRGDAFGIPDPKLTGAGGPSDNA